MRLEILTGKYNGRAFFAEAAHFNNSPHILECESFKLEEGRTKHYATDYSE